MKKYIFAGMLIFCSNVNAWENKVSHIDISEAAAKLSFTNEQRKLQYVLNGQKKRFFS